jgi:hypothetical protein
MPNTWTYCLLRSAKTEREDERLSRGIELPAVPDRGDWVCFSSYRYRVDRRMFQADGPAILFLDIDHRVAISGSP